MTNKKKIVSRILLVIVALTLISFCFIGTTLARYTSENSGSASTGVAKWDISMSLEDSGTFTFDSAKLSPSMDDYAAGSDRVNGTGRVLLATIENKGDVSATVTIAVDDESVTKSSGTYGDQINLDGTGDPTEQNVLDRFSLNLYWSSTNDAAAATVAVEGARPFNPGDKMYLFAEVAWTSADTMYKNFAGDDAVAEVMSDALDTWIGKNITAVSYQVSYTAVQASEQPTA